jgi:hypothetical protein
MRINSFIKKGINKVLLLLLSPLLVTTLRLGTLYKKEKAGELFSRLSILFIVLVE